MYKRATLVPIFWTKIVIIDKNDERLVPEQNWPPKPNQI